jgi:hypothetical protein
MNLNTLASSILAATLLAIAIWGTLGPPPGHVGVPIGKRHIATPPL